MPIRIRKKVSVLLSGGGTGGHIYPLLAVGDWLRNFGEGEIKVTFAGWAPGFRKEFEERYMSAYAVFPAKVRRYFSFKNFLDAPLFLFSMLQALFWVWIVMPDVVFSKGGPSAFPVILAARFYKIPVVIHESDAVPSVTNRLSAKFASRIGISFDSTAKEFPDGKAFFSGNPIRAELMRDWLDSFSAKSYFKLNPELPLLVVVGGSQGSLRINNFILDNLVELLEKVQVIHQVGKENYKDALKLSEITLRGSSEELKKKYIIRDYVSAKDMKIALNAADIVLTRSGSFIHELALFGKPAILIPLADAANDHQRANAYEYAGKGAALVIEEENFSSHVFLNEVQKLLEPKRAEAMAQAARALVRLDATEVVGR
ncbi:MAG: UDP-N-acetylglucosamine--N-acetylmuramyl-(pentapeptide) pyrophosphoryl-undecaprenol N-acetylglucosamine transferase, partial [Patescibacteria group bacterium]